MNQDITKILSDWPFGDGTNVRRIVGEDGKEKIQIRVCIDTFHGMLQFNADGRPDGKRPMSSEFYLDHLERKKRRLIEGGGHPQEYKLSKSQCKKLFDESSQIYHRYVVMLQLGDYQRVIRDTARNMRLFRFVHGHAQHAEDRNHLECWWPYILRLHFTARAMEGLSDGRFRDALAAIRDCREQLSQLTPVVDNEVYEHEYKRSVEALDEMEKEIAKRMPLSKVEKLERDKEKAIKEERFEDAARLRDRIERVKARTAAEHSAKSASASGRARAPGGSPDEESADPEADADDVAGEA